MGKGKAVFILGTILVSFMILFFAWVVVNYDDVNSTEVTTIKVGVSQTPLSAPFIIAEELGLLSHEALNIKLVPCFGGVECTILLVNGEVKYATASESVVMFESFKGNDIALLTSFVSSDGDVKLLTPSVLNINHVSDLKDKRIGVVKASSSEFYLDSVLSANNQKHLDFEKVYLNATHMVSALQNSQVDAISVWEPFGYQAHIEFNSQVNDLGIKGVYELSFNLISLQQYFGSSDDEALIIIDVLGRAIEWINHHPDEAISILSRYLDVKPEQLLWSWNYYVFRLSLGNSLLHSIQLQSRWARDEGLVEGDEPNFRSVLYSTPFDKYQKTGGIR